MQNAHIHLKFLLLAPAAAVLLGCGDAAKVEEQQQMIDQQKAKIAEQQQMIEQQKAKVAELQDSSSGLNAQLAALNQEKVDFQAQVEQARKEGAGSRQRTIQILQAQHRVLPERYKKLDAASRQSMKELGALLQQ